MTRAAWIVLTVACYIAAELAWPLALAIPLSLLLAMLLLQAVIIASGFTARLFTRHENHLRFNGAVLGAALLAAAAYYAQSASWARFAAWQFLAGAALSAIVLLIRTRARRVILGFAAAAPLALVLLWPWSPAAGIGVVVLSHMLVLYPTLTPSAQWLGPVVTRFATNRKEVWLTIDDGPGEQTRAVLDLLDGYEAKATFFVKGILARRHADVVREIVARGHSVANHSDTHPSGTFWCLLPRRIAAEIDGCNHALEELTGRAPRWFRAPVGMKNPAVHPALARRGMRLIGWSARGFDGVLADANAIAARLLPQLRPGAILLMHEGREHSLRALERVLAAVRERGYAFVIPDDAALRNTKR